jgi:hypothetical protein
MNIRNKKEAALDTGKGVDAKIKAEKSTFSCSRVSENRVPREVLGPERVKTAREEELQNCRTSDCTDILCLAIVVPFIVCLLHSRSWKTDSHLVAHDTETQRFVAMHTKAQYCTR